MRAKPYLFARARRALAAATSREPAIEVFVPGRIEVLGKHTDYAGGCSLLCAIDRGLAFVATPRDDDAVHVIDAADGSDVALALSPRLPAFDGWGTYPA